MAAVPPPPLPPTIEETAESRRQASKQDPAVETAEEATEPAEADINELCKDMFNKMAIYLTGELTATSEDYKLLENMNKLTSLKYLEMKDIAINISRNLKDLNQKYAGLQPYLEQINLIEDQVAALEQAAYKLDAYSKKLELSLNWGNSRRSNGAFQAAYVTDHYFCYQPSHEKQSTKNWRNDERSTLCNETSRIPDFSYKKSDQISLTC